MRDPAALALDVEDFERAALDAWLEANPPTQVAYVTILEVETGKGAGRARAQFLVGGGAEAMTFGAITPVAGQKWRALRPYGGAWVLDDRAYLVAGD